MAEQWKTDLTLVVSDSSVEKISEAETIEATKNYSERKVIEIADETVDREIDFTDLGKVEEMLIISDNTISIKKDANTGTAIPCKVLYLSGTSFTTLFISNDSGETAKVKFIFGG